MKQKLFKSLLILVMAFVSVVSISCAQKFSLEKNITVVSREDGSGTKAAFMEIIGLKGKSDVSGCIKPSSTPAVLNEVKSNPHAIGFESLGYVNENVKALKIDGVAPSVENILNGSYKISRPLSVVYKESSLDKEVNKAFYEFLQSSESQEIITKEGYVSLNQSATNYKVKLDLSGKIEISGSTSLEPLMIKLVEKFESLQTNVTVNVGGGGSGTGYKNADNGVSDFGMISEEFNQTKAPSCTSYVVAKDGIAVIVNKLNTIDTITLENLKNIYNSEAGDAQIKIWADVK